MSEEKDIVGIPDKEQRNWGALCHVSALIGYVFPLGNILGPLVIWILKKDEMPFVDDQGKESINFQITVLLAFIVCAILTLAIIGFFLFALVAIYQIIAIVLASIKANEGVNYRYPYILRLIK